MDESSIATRKHRFDAQRRAEIGRERKAKTRAKIIAAAFDRFGHESGLFATIEEIADGAGITRTTFYNHFSGMGALREALTDEIAHEFLLSVTEAVLTLPDPAEQASAAIRFYLAQARADSRWAWSMLNLSANGVIFGAETYRQAEGTVQKGIAEGSFPLADCAVGRDIILGGTLAAIATQARSDTTDSFAGDIACHILMGLGVPADRSADIARRPLPPRPPAG